MLRFASENNFESRKNDNEIKGSIVFCFLPSLWKNKFSVPTSPLIFTVACGEGELRLVLKIESAR